MFTRLCMLEKYPSHGAITLFTLPKKLQTIQMIDFRVIAIFGQIYKDFVCFILRFRMHRSYTEITVAFRTSSFSPRPTCGSALLTVNIILFFFLAHVIPVWMATSLFQKPLTVYIGQQLPILCDDGVLENHVYSVLCCNERHTIGSYKSMASL